MPEQNGDKQHEATAYRRQQAREQGQVAKSQDLSSALMLLGAVLVLLQFGGGFAQFLTDLSRRQLGGEAWLTNDPNTFADLWAGVLGQLATTVLPIFLLLAVLAALTNIGQVGFLFVPKKLGFDPSRISPLKGVQRLFSLSNAVRLGFGIFKVIVVAAVAAWCLWAELDRILGLTAASPAEVASYVLELTLWTCFKIGLALLILAIFDFAYQKWKYEQDLRMTTQEMREEMKSLQGDPQVAARRRQVQRELVMSRMGTAVPKADVVVTNPTHLAVALQYDHETMDAPVVVAKGADFVAQRIRRLALEHNIPIVERKPLAQALFRVDIGKPVPADQYAAMAEVLRYVYQLKGKTLPEMEPAA